jgi:hypothetical protein
MPVTPLFKSRKFPWLPKHRYLSDVPTFANFRPCEHLTKAFIFPKIFRTLYSFFRTKARYFQNFQIFLEI